MGVALPHSALSQVVLVSFVCFAGPGLYNALTSFASGMADPTVGFNGTATLYGTFALFSFIAAGIVNIIGPKLAVFLGATTYIVYALSLYICNENFIVEDDGTVVYSTGAIVFYYLANVICGMGAGLLWTGQGQVTMAYPTTENKGLYFSIFWIIFNLGGTIGGFLAFGVNYSQGADGTSSWTYISFIIVMVFGVCCALLMVKPETVVRNDGSLVKVDSLPDWKSEAVAVLKLFVNPVMLMLLPLFIYSNWFYSYHGFYNTTVFNTRTNGFAAAFNYGSQMIGALLLGKWLDRPSAGVRYKSYQSLAIITVLIFIMWGVGLYAQLTLDLKYGDANKLNVDYTDSNFLPKLLLYMFYGCMDAVAQVWAYWLMGMLSDDMATLGRFAGFYKCVQSASAFVAWKITGSEVEPLVQLLINWGLFTCAVIGAFFAIKNYVKDELEEDGNEGDNPRDSWKLAGSPMGSSSHKLHTISSKGDLHA